jgi:predicted methyltransferase
MFARMRMTQAPLILSLLAAVGCSETAYRSMNDPARDAWQQPKAVVQALKITPGSRVADLGAGGGYFTWYLADAVGPQGKVYAADVEEVGLRMVREEAGNRRVGHIETVRSTAMDARLPERVDLLFTCNTYHHLQDRAAYFRALARSLTPAGRVAIIEYKPAGLAWLFGHSTSEETVRAEMESAGYQLVEAPDFLPKQHFQIFRPAPQ